MFVNPFSFVSQPGLTAGTTAQAKIEQATTTEEVILPPELKATCGCESNWDPYSEPRQFGDDGLPLQGKNYHDQLIVNEDGSTTTVKVHWSSDWGACQINDATWDAEAKRLGLDYKNSKNDNYKMALHVKDVQGMDAWKHSGSCSR